MTTNMPRLGDPAPDFTAVTTIGEIGFHDWQEDQWVLLFSHPADFTPVCSTELVALAKEEAAFRERNTKLLGLSVDSIHSHLAWHENLKQIFDVSISFPMIADLDRNVASVFGMIHDGESSTATVRAVFVIDPTHTIRAVVYYPLNVGRNVAELIRLIDGLQMADGNGVATPVNWCPGDKVVVPPPKTLEDVDERNANKTYERFDFYLNKKEV